VSMTRECECSSGRRIDLPPRA